MKYIAYGSNMNLEQMAFRCPNSKVYCKGYLKGWKLVFNVHADIIPTGNEEDIVPVLVWEIASDDWKTLDRYEGYPRYYDKLEVNTCMEYGTEEVCIVYVMTPGRKGYEPPYQDYFDVIEIGCKENDIDVNYLYKALDEAYEKWNVKEG